PRIVAARTHGRAFAGQGMPDAPVLIRASSHGCFISIPMPVAGVRIPPAEATGIPYVRRTWERVRFTGQRFRVLLRTSGLPSRNTAIHAVGGLGCRHQYGSAFVLYEEHDEFRRLRLACVPPDHVDIVWAFVEGLARSQSYLFPASHLHHDRTF